MEKAKEDIYQLRKLQVLPYSLNSVINHDCWKYSMQQNKKEQTNTKNPFKYNYNWL